MLLAPLLVSAAFALQEGGRPDALELVRSAQLFVPPYEGDPQALLTADEERDVSVASALLDAALLLDGGVAYVWWWKGHCEVLLAENARNRGRLAEGRSHHERALEAFDHSITHDPDYYWAHYARGTALAQADRFWEAIESFDQAELLAEESIDTADDALLVRFHARRWRADSRMRTLELEQAREELRAFYAANGNNLWDLGTALAESFQRERDFGAARAAYEDILAVERLVPYPQTYEQIANLAGLVEADEEAVRWLRRSFDHERDPSMYRRLWLWILTSGDERAQVSAELEEFLRHPPSGLSAWDGTLGRFVLGEGSVEDFLAAAEAERERRMREAIPLDDLSCEAWFYVGLRREQDAALSRKTPVVELLQGALDAYRQALAFRPRQSKWEWEWARLRFARLARQLELEPHPGFHCEGRELVLAADTPLDGGAPVRRGRLELVLRHTPGEGSGTRGVGGLGEAPLAPGELIQCVLLDADGRRHALSLVVDAGN